METQQFIEKELHTKSKFLNFLVYWIITFCQHHSIDVVQALSLILNHLITQHEQKSQPVELHTAEEATKE